MSVEYAATNIGGWCRQINLQPLEEPYHSMKPQLRKVGVNSLKKAKIYF